jgi:hypothetical protein
MAAQNCRKFRWTEAKRKAALEIARGQLTNAEIARKAGISQRGLYDWKLNPDFAAYVQEMGAHLAALAERYGIGRVARRLARLDKTWNDLQRVVKQRGQSDEMKGVPGGKTGLLVHDVKVVGGGEHAEKVDLYRVDTGLLDQLLALEERAAEELGQRHADRPAGEGGGDRPFAKVYLFDPRRLAQEGVIDEPQRLPPVRADEPGSNGPAATS